MYSGKYLMHIQDQNKFNNIAYRNEGGVGKVGGIR